MIRVGSTAVVLAVALVQGLIYLFLLPPWQHYDEPTHFEYAAMIAEQGRLPAEREVDETIRREIARSMVEHNFFVDLPAPDLNAPAHEIWIGISQLDDSPLYYLLVSLPLRLVGNWSVTNQLYVARGVSLALFLATVLVAVGMMRDLTAPGHPLRWGVPLALAAVGPFVDLMTAVNNDAAAVFIFSLFLWGGVRSIRFGLTPGRAAWVIGTAALGPVTKSTAATTLVLAPLVFIIAVAAGRGWRWRWPVAATAALAAVGLVTMLTWGDAALWYRWYGLDQETATRVEVAEAPLGRHAVRLALRDPWTGYRVATPILEEDLAVLRGQRVTVGGWVWADREMSIDGPGVLWSARGTRSAEAITAPAEVSTTPRFVAHSFVVPEETGKLYFAFFGGPKTRESQAAALFLDGAVLVAGEFPAATPPVFDDSTARSGRWDGRPFANLVRNASAESAGPRFRPWFVRVVKGYTAGERVYTLAPLMDVQQSGPVIERLVTRWFPLSFFGRYSWGQINLPVMPWRLVFQVLAAGAVAGCVVWWIRARPSIAGGGALVFLLIAASAVWLLALAWPLAYMFWDRIPLPSVRYTFPVIIPTILALVGGWWALWPHRLRVGATAALVMVLLVVNAAGIWTVWNFFQSGGGAGS